MNPDKLEQSIEDAKADIEQAEITCRHRADQLQIARQRMHEARAEQIRIQKNYLRLLRSANADRKEPKKP